MNEAPANLDARAARVLLSCEPYLITWPGNVGSLNLTPLGTRIADHRLYDPTRLRSRHVIDALHILDSFTFGGQEMLMPRWVMFDCGEFPGIVFGFGATANTLPNDVRTAYQVAGPEFDDRFVPLSMWVALRCAEPDAWFGHNLSSANLVARSAPLPGLGTVTKAYGIAVTGAKRQYGATQWDSASLGIHLSFGTVELLCAYTPAHTHDYTFAYRIAIDEKALTAPLRPGFAQPTAGGDRSIDCDDTEAILALHDEIEAGACFQLFRRERLEPGRQRLWLKAL